MVTGKACAMRDHWCQLDISSICVVGWALGDRLLCRLAKSLYFTYWCIVPQFHPTRPGCHIVLHPCKDWTTECPLRKQVLITYCSLKVPTCSHNRLALLTPMMTLPSIFWLSSSFSEAIWLSFFVTLLYFDADWEQELEGRDKITSLT